MKSVIVTGGTSFIGSALIHTLLQKDTECYVVVRKESKNLDILPIQHPRLHVIKGNASNPSEWINLVPNCDVFFHFAWDGIGSVGRASSAIQIANVEMATECLKAAANLKCKRFVFAGSQAEYGINDGIITESTECNPNIEYGKGKLAFLHRAIPLSNELGIEYVHLRIFSVYGPGDHPWTLVSRCLNSFSQNKAIDLSSCVQKWNYLYVTEAAEIISLFGECLIDSDPVYNVAGEETKPLKEYVEEMHNLCGGGRPRYGALANQTEVPHGIDPVIVKMQQATGWKMKVDFETGIRNILTVRGANNESVCSYRTWKV